MATSTDLKQRAQTLAAKTDINSIDPQEVGGLFYDMAGYAEDVQRNGGSLGIRKVYASVSAMEADSTSPVDMWGNPMRKGQLCVIYDGTTTGADNNKIFAFKAPGWEIATQLDAGYATRGELEELEDKINSSGLYKGYFQTLEQLKAEYPSPKYGETAWVGDPYPGNVYDVVDGAWHDTGMPAQEGGGGSGTTDYGALENKPSINNITLEGNKSLDEIGIASKQSVERLEIPVVDSSLSTTSPNAIQNKVVTAEINKINDSINDNTAFVLGLTEKVNALSGVGSTFIGYYANPSELPEVDKPSWALVGELSAVSIYANYMLSDGSSNVEQEISVNIEQGTWSENNGNRLSPTASPGSEDNRLRSDDAIFLTKGVDYTININNGFQVFIIFFLKFVTNELDSDTNTVAKFVSWQSTSYSFTAEYNYMAIVIRKADNSNISTSDDYGLSVKKSVYAADGWNDLSGQLGTYNFTSFNLPTFVMPTSLAGNSYDTEGNLIKGAIRIVGNKLVFKKGCAFYVYMQEMGDKSTFSYYFENSSRSDIEIDMQEGNFVALDLEKSQRYPATTYLSVGSSIVVGNWGNFNTRQLVICQKRVAHITVNPVFVWMLYYDKIAGASQNDFAILGNNASFYLEKGKLIFPKNSYFYIYRNTGGKASSYLRINSIEDFELDLNSEDYNFSSLAIDGSKVDWENDGTNINIFADVIKKVSGGKYSSEDIPLLHVRSNKIFIHPIFQSLFSYKNTTEQDEDIYSINVSNFLPSYYSVCRGKRNTFTMQASWKDRLNLLHISDNHATNPDGYRNIEEAIKVSNIENIRLNALIDTGDLTNGFGVGTPKQSVIDTLNRVRDLMLKSGVTPLVNLGNHDANDWGNDVETALTKKEQWDAIFKELSSKYNDVMFGGKIYSNPSYITKTIEPGTWRETIGCRASDEALPGLTGLRLRSNDAINLVEGKKYVLQVNSGYSIFVILFSKFVSNELDYTGNTVKSYINYSQKIEFVASSDEVAMAVVIKKNDESAISISDDYGLSITSYSLTGENYRHYSYYDMNGDDYGSVRIIMLDQLDHDLPTDSEGKLIYSCITDPVYSQEQIDWLCNTALQVQDGTGIIICNHYPFDITPSTDPSESLVIDGKYVQPWNMIPDIINAWQERISINKSYADTVGSQNISVNADFSAIGSNCEFICYLCGHTHYKTHKQVTGYKQMMLLEDSSGSLGTVYSDVVRLYGSPVSNAFSILSIDRNQGMIYRTCYGAYKSVDNTEQSRIENISYRFK